MNIIIEGPDGAGKTSLIEQLKKEFGSHVVQVPTKEELMDGPPKDKESFQKRLSKFREKFYWHEGYDTNYPEFQIFDRCPYVSEYVYGNILRGESYIDISVMENFMDKSYSILVLPAPHLFQEQVVETNKDHKDEKHLDEVLASRMELYTNYRDLGYLFDVTYDRSEKLAFEKLVLEIRSEKLDDQALCVV